MNDFISMECPSCGAGLSISPDETVLRCKYCGTEHIIKNDSGQISFDQSNTWICPNPACKNRSAAGTNHCTKCGTALKRDCPKCSQPIYAGNLFCPMCGADIQQIEREIAQEKLKINQLIDEKQQQQKLIGDEIQQLGEEASAHHKRILSPFLVVLSVMGGCTICFISPLLLQEGSQSDLVNFAVFSLAFFGLALFIGALYLNHLRNKSYRHYRAYEDKILQKKKEIAVLDGEILTLWNKSH